MKKLRVTLFINQSGLTLIELLLYIAIFSIIITAVVSISISATAQRVRNNAIAEVDYQGEAVISYIMQTIRNSQTINSPSPNNTSGSISVNTNLLANNPTVFDSVSDGLRQRIRVREGNPSTDNFLTNNRVTVTNISFTNSAIVGGRDSIKIQFTLQYYNPSARPELDYQKTFYGGATLR
jgi:prepilin-type N-terminal cleavage/methylation domain-containing protein